MILDWPEVHLNIEILLFGSSKPYPSISREKKKNPQEIQANGLSQHQRAKGNGRMMF